MINFKFTKYYIQPVIGIVFMDLYTAGNEFWTTTPNSIEKQM
jgi:hypothetical protein